VIKTGGEEKDIENNELLEGTDYEFGLGISDIAVRNDYEFFPANGHRILFGAAGIVHTYLPGISVVDRTTLDVGNQRETFGPQRYSNPELNVYVEDEFDLDEKLTFNAGLHFSGFFTESESFLTLQPRVLLNYQFTERWAFKSAYSRMQQNLHLLSNSGAGVPTDLWVPATPRARPESSDQLSIGLAHTFHRPQVTFSIEGYYKTMDNLIEFKDGASFLGGESENWEDKIVTDGKGRSYGLEVLLQKKVGKTTGWISYTWSKTERQFSNLNQGRYFPYRYDRTHDVSVVFQHTFSPKTTLSATWVYGTGNAITLATAGYNLQVYDYRTRFDGTEFSPEGYIQNEKVHLYGERNGYRMEAYHRLDINASFTKQKDKGIRIWRVGSYNLYNRQNPYFLYFDRMPNTNARGLYKFSLFPILPSISYTYKFG
jgi:hypothetical protein